MKTMIQGSWIKMHDPRLLWDQCADETNDAQMQHGFKCCFT